jgi:hypothetical protein
MPLTLRPTGLSSPAYADKLDYVVCEDGKVIGRIYEDWHTLPDLRWFWSITVYVDPKQGINTSGRAATPSLAQATVAGQFTNLDFWTKRRRSPFER